MTTLLFALVLVLVPANKLDYPAPDASIKIFHRLSRFPRLFPFLYLGLILPYFSQACSVVAFSCLLPTHLIRLGSYWYLTASSVLFSLFLSVILAERCVYFYSILFGAFVCKYVQIRKFVTYFVLWHIIRWETWVWLFSGFMGTWN